MSNEELDNEINTKILLYKEFGFSVTYSNGYFTSFYGEEIPDWIETLVNRLYQNDWRKNV